MSTPIAPSRPVMSKRDSGQSSDAINDNGDVEEISGRISRRHIFLIAGLATFVGAWILGLAYVVIQYQKSKGNDLAQDPVSRMPAKKEWQDTIEEFQQGSVHAHVTRVGIYRPALTSSVDRVTTLHSVGGA